MNEESVPKVGMSMLKRAVLAGLAIVLMSGAAVSAAVLLQVDDVINIVERNGRRAIKVAEITPSEAGKPQTIMVLGTDKRAGGIDKDRPALSDTIILVRLDKDKRRLAALRARLAARPVAFAAQAGGARPQQAGLTRNQAAGFDVNLRYN